MSGPVDWLGADPLREADAMESLAAAIRRVENGAPPTAEELLAMPLLRGWHFWKVPTPVLVGKVYGHPLMEDGKTVVTSAIHALDRNAGWARTRSRFYRLGAASMRGMER